MRIPSDLRERVQGAFYDREARELRPLVWGLVGLVMAVVGLSIFAMDVAAALAGQSTVVVSKRRSTHMAVEVRALFMLFIGTAGAATVDNAIRLGYPDVHKHCAYRWPARLILAPLVLGTFVLGGFVVFVHFVR